MTLAAWLIVAAIVGWLYAIGVVLAARVAGGLTYGWSQQQQRFVWRFACLSWLSLIALVMMVVGAWLFQLFEEAP